MKIPGKFPKNNLFSKISNLNQSQKGLIKDSLNQKGVVSVDLKKLIYKKSKKTFSTRFINYVEPYEISGVRYTLFYTEVDHNLSKGDRVFIVGGNYDSDLIIRANPFNSKSDGYLVQYVDRTKVVLDIEWINITPWEEEPIDNFIKVYVASSQDEFDFLWKSVSYRGTILVNYQGTDQPFLANKFAYDPITGNSMGNVLFSNGTFDTIEINDDSISGNPTYSYTFNILEVDPTSTGALTTGNILDVTSDVLSGNYTNFNNMSNGLFKIIGGSFELNGTSFQEGYIYYFDVSDSKFKVKREYSQPFITEQNFRNGRFKKGNFNQGLLGDNLNKIEYYGDNFDFKLGTIVNVNWNSGDIESGEGNVLSHNTSYDGISQPNIKISGNNNSGYGYNYAFNTNFLNGSSLNGNFFNSTFGTSSNSNVIYNDIQSMSLTYSFYANGGNYYGSTFNYSKITKSLIGNSKINNTVIDLSKSVNSELSRTLFNNSKFISDKIIKIQKYSEHVISRVDLTSSDSIQKYKLYKFYINENDFLTRLSNFDSIYFDVSVSGGTDSDLFNFFDDKFTIGEYTLSFDETTGKSSKKIIVQLSTKEDNKYVPYQVDLDVPYQTDTLLESNPNYGLPSIDIMYTDYGQSFLGKYYTYIEVGTWLSSPFNYPVPFAFSSFYINSGLNPPYTLSNGLSINLGDDIYDIVGYLSTLTGENWLYDPILEVLYLYSDQPSIVDSIFISSSGSPIYIKESIKSTTPKLDIINGYIIDSDFKSGLFKNSNWVSGNYMNYNKDYSLSTDTLGYYLTSSIATSSGYPMITLSIKDQLRYDLIENGDMVFMNGLHYDTTLNGGDNLVRLNDSYLVNGFTTSTPDRSIEIIDILGTQSLLNNVPSFTNQNYLITKNAENNYNYLHPVKFQNSKIESGIFRRPYFSGCEFINQTFNNLDKDILPGNVRKLLVSDSIFDDSSNIIKSGLFRHSSFISGSDIWQNGILYNSIWNRDSYTYSISATGSSILTITESSFNSGIVKNSRWVYGQFDNGQFISNKTNQTGTSSVYDDSIPTHWRKNFETRYSWIDGEFNGGQFELSNWENGEFNNGEFFNSTFMSGEATGGLFGRINIPFSLTKILSGSFSNVEVINAEFRSQDPSGQISATFSIDWHSGKFNSGLFGVKIVDQEYSNLEESYPYTSTWYGGDFNGGDFTDISKWIDGKFNGGKFTSYYGMPYTPIYQYRISNSDRFAWVGGEFNGGEFGNFSTDLNSTWYDGEFNGGIFAGRYWRNGVFTKGSFIGSGTSSTKLSNVSNYISDYSDYFYGLWEGGNVTELKESVILGKKFYTKIEREFSKKKKKPEVNFSGVLWMGGTFSHNDGLIDNSVWLDGSFEKGIFRNSSFNPYVNYLTNDSLNSLSDWEIVYGSSGSNVSNYSSNIEWSGTSSTTVIYQTAGLIAGDQYTANFKINSIINSTIRYGNWISPVDGNFNSIGNWETYSNGTSTASIISGYPGYAILSDNSGPTDYCLLYQEGILESNKIYSILFYYNGAPLGTNIEVGTMDSGDENTFSPDLIVGISGYGTLSGTFSSVYTDLAIRYSSTLLSGTQITGIVVTENYSLVSTGPYPQEISLSFTASGPNFALEFLSDGVPGISGPSWLDGSASIEFIEVIRGESGFNTSPNCIWKNGLFDNSEFFFSKWLNGKWLNGTGYGMIWENGISNYMNAYNIYWGGGLWRNGNWNGSPFNLGNIVGSQSFVSSGFASDILTNISLYRKEIGDIEYQNIFINNAFTQSSINQLLSDPDLDNGMGDLSNQSIKVFNTIPSSDHNWQSFPFLTLYSLSSGGWDPSISMTPDAGVQSPIGTTTQPSNILYTSISGDTDVFDDTLHQYDITIVYNAYYGPITITPSTSGPTTQAQATSRFRVKYGNSTNGGDEHIIEDQILNISNMNGSNSVFFGRTSNNTLNYTFAPTNLTGQKLLIQRILTCDPSITINILSIEINKRIVLYDHIYNNATYSIMGVNPQYGDQLELPSIEYLGGANAGGQITIQFGNGMFESGTFSSIWENGVWNQGMRYDKNVIYFDDLKLFDGTSKPLTYKGNVSNNGSNEKSYSQNISSNKSYQEGIVSYKSSTWILSMRLSIGTLNFEDGYITFQDLSTISNKLKIGDKVSVGNIITIDINGNRRLLKDHLTIVKIENEYISLQFTSNFPIRGVEKDSQNHLIYLSKNIWLNGAFLNGKFRGIWNNGLFRGYPYITKMVDSQWIDGRFDGGRFRGITHSHITIDNSEVIYHSGLVQNFNFNDGDTLSSLTHSYNSWIDVNYHTYSAVSINNNMVLNNDLLGEYSITEFYSRPTVDILGSKSKLRNNSDFIINEFSLGHKYKEYVNYFEDIGQFEKYYNSSPTSSTMLGMNNLINDGFTWSSPNLSILSNDQQSNSGILNLEFQNLGIYFINRSLPLNKKRYSYISFDIVEQNNLDSLFLSFDTPPGYMSSILSQRPSNSIKEYFFNKIGLNLISWQIISNAGNIKIDNLKLVETDMIPFLQLATESHINQDIAFPLESVAPFIDYSDSNFSLIDNLNITETIFVTVPSSTSLTSAGISKIV